MLKTLSDITQLQGDLIKEFGEDGINVVERNSTLLAVAFINSKLNDETSLKRQERAQ